MSSVASASSVLVTGGTGFLGRRLVERLLAQGRSVTVLARRPAPDLAARGVRFVCAPLEDEAAVRRACAGAQTVFHVAAKVGVWGRYDDFFRANVLGTRAILAGCREHGVARLVHTSTPSVVYNGRPLAGADESLPLTTSCPSPYPLTKAIAEREVLAAHSAALRTVALRPHLIWGVGDPHLVPRVLARARAGRLRIVGDGHNRVDMVHVDNAVDAHLLAEAALARPSATGDNRNAVRPPPSSLTPPSACDPPRASAARTAPDFAPHSPHPASPASPARAPAPPSPEKCHLIDDTSPRASELGAAEKSAISAAGGGATTPSDTDEMSHSAAAIAAHAAATPEHVAATAASTGVGPGGRAYFITNGEPVGLWEWINALLVALGEPPVTKRLPLGAASALGALCEAAWRVLPLAGEPPMTRFIAAELAKDHWFDLSAARRDLGYEPRVSMAAGTAALVAHLRSTSTRAT